MAVKKYKPTTPGQRGMTGYTFEEITKSTPERSLIVHPRSYGGRDTTGRITVRHRGGGNRKYIRIIDFNREKHNIPAKVAAIEYDPNRTARLALLFYADGVKRYIIAPLGIQVGDTLISGRMPKSGRQLPAALPYPGRHAGACPSNYRRARVRHWFVPLAVPRNCWPKRANMPRSACLPVKFA